VVAHTKEKYHKQEGKDMKILIIMPELAEWVVDSDKVITF